MSNSEGMTIGKKIRKFFLEYDHLNVVLFLYILLFLTLFITIVMVAWS